MRFSFVFTLMRQGSAFMLAAALFCLGGSASAAERLIQVLLSEESASYRAFATALQAELPQAVVRVLGTEPPDAAPVVVAVGPRAARAAVNAPVVLNVMVSRALHERLLTERRSRGSYAAIYLEQPLARQLELAALALPKKRDVGLLYTSLPADELHALRAEAARRGLRLVEKQIEPGSGLYESLQALLQQCDVLLATPDTEIYNPQTLRNILISSYRERVPLIGLSSSFVSAGALAALSSTPEGLARQAAAMLRQQAESGTLPASQYPHDFGLVLNSQVARSLNVPLDAVRLSQQLEQLRRAL